MKNNWILVGVLTLVLLFTLGVGLGWAQVQEPENVFAPQGQSRPVTAVSDEIPIQGRLTDASGNPINGTRTITFTLYDSSVGGTMLCQDVDNVTVTNGLFSARMGFCTASDINGQQLYLGMQVSGDAEMATRQAILPVPYAWSLRPGANISGTVSADAVVHVENSAADGRAVRGYATSPSGINYGIVGRSYSSNGYAGYFVNDAGGTALYAQGTVSFTTNAGSAKAINVGERYRDNAIVAWGQILGTGIGSIQADFGVSAVDHFSTGSYTVTLDAHAANAASLVPMAIAEIDSAPASAATVRIISINQVASGTFVVYINNGSWQLVDNDFVFMVTAR